MLATRAPKQDHPLAELEVEWRERAAEVGLTPDRLEQVMGGGRPVTPVDRKLLFERLASPDGLTERASTFGRAEVVKDVAGSLPEGATRREIESLAGTFLDTPDVVPLLPAPNTELVAEADSPNDAVCDRLDELNEAAASGQPMRRRDGTLFPGVRHERRYATTELLVTEQRIIEQAMTGVGAGRWAAPGRLVEGGCDATGI